MLILSRNIYNINTVCFVVVPHILCISYYTKISIHDNIATMIEKQLCIVFSSEWIQYDFGTSVIVSTIEIFNTDGGEKGFLTYLFHKDRKIPVFSGGRQIYLTLLVWLLMQDKKSTRYNSIVSTACSNGVHQN